MTSNIRQLLLRVGLCGIYQNNQNHTNTFRVKSAQRQRESLQALSWHWRRQNIWQQNSTSSTETCTSPSVCPNSSRAAEPTPPRRRCHGPCHQQESTVWLPASLGIRAIVPQGQWLWCWLGARTEGKLTSALGAAAVFPGWKGNQRGILSHLRSAVL